MGNEAWEKAVEPKLSQNELRELFGDEIPVEAVDIFWNSPGEKTLGEIREELRALAARLKAPTPFKMASEVAAKALSRDHYERRFGVGAHAVMNADANWHVFLDTARIALRAAFPTLADAMMKGVENDLSHLESHGIEMALEALRARIEQMKEPS